jgi:hypothetical protein
MGYLIGGIAQPIGKSPPLRVGAMRLSIAAMLIAVSGRPAAADNGRATAAIPGMIRPHSTQSHLRVPFPGLCDEHRLPMRRSGRADHRSGR